MADYYKLASTTNPHTDWTTEVVLEVNDQGEPTKVVRAGEPVQLSAEERKTLESLGYSLESSSKSEADEAEARTAQAGSDVTGAAPVFGTTAGEANQTSGQQSGSKSDKK